MDNPLRDWGFGSSLPADFPVAAPMLHEMQEAALISDNPHIGASFRRLGEKADIYRVWMDGPVLRIDAQGVWDIETAEAYARDIIRIIAELRLASPFLRAIVDRSSMPIFGASVHELLLHTYDHVLRSGDRVALVVDSSLAKGQIRRIAGREETQTFLSISAARTWALAYD